MLTRYDRLPLGMTSVEAVREAVREALTKEKPRKFTQSVELVINLRDIDLKKPENRFTEVIELPHGLGSKARKVNAMAALNRVVVLW